eukprot:scaffold33543_cov174-Skeletonema_dohrnii-CCMP3373.AAC.6
MQQRGVRRVLWAWGNRIPDHSLYEVPKSVFDETTETLPYAQTRLDCFYPNNKVEIPLCDCLPSY